MSAPRIMFAAVAVAILLLGATAAFGYAGWEAGNETEVTNETFQPADNKTVELQYSNQPNTLYSDTVTVTNTTDGTEFHPGGNYTWHDGNGTLFVEGNSDLAAASEANATYSFSETNAEAYGFIQMFASITEFGDALVWALIAACVLAAARVFGGAG